MELIEKLGIDWKILIAQIINFSLLLAILYYFLYKPILNVLEKRRKKIKKSLREADAINKRMENVRLEIEKKITQSEKEATQIIKDTKIQMDKDRERIRREAIAESEEIKKEAKEMVKQERKGLIDEAKKELGELVITLSEKVIQRNLQDVDRKKLDQELIDSVNHKIGS
ncbi:MAG: F0F1 ATP synthase subunit B [Patescibacteria group bacterium]|nr:F0F1 ATP synthase subunit B [Patescibacteria group bacterium]